MSKVHTFLKKHWKPPYELLKFILLICLISGCINVVNAQTESNNDSDNDDVVVRTESTPFSIKFFIDDDKYELLNVSCKNIKTLEHPDAQELECTNLSPCSNYLATIKIKNGTAEEITKFMDVSTLYAKPTTELDKPISYQESINITWKSTNPTCISEYILNVTDKTIRYEFSYSTEVHEKTMVNLNPCQEYSIQLDTYDVDKVMISAQSEIAETLYAEPGDISVTIEEVSSTQMKIKWTPPQYKTCVYFYYIKWYLKDCEAINQDDTSKERDKFFFQDSRSSESNEESTVTTTAPTVETTFLPTVPPSVEADACVSTAKIIDIGAKEYTINGLKGCEDYGLEIYINTNETEKSDLHDFISPEQVPGLVTVSDPLLSESEVTIRWSQPVDNKKCVNFYKVSITGPTQKPSEDQTANTTDRFQTDVTFSKLSPCGHYEYSITGVLLSGNNGPSMQSSFDTIESKPTPVRNYRVSEDAHNITVSWDPPDFAELCLNGYRLSGWRDNNNPSPEFDKVTNDTTVLIEDLNACQTYTVQIIPMTKYMNDGELLQIEIETKPIIALAPKDFQAISQYPNSLELSAQASDFNNNCETIFARFTCEANSKGVLHKKAERYVERGQVGDISFKALLEPLSPFTDYKCTVSLFNIAGWSANGTTIQKTEPYFPDPPQSVGTKSTSKTSINFTWKTPNYANGNIKLYISYIQRVEEAYFVPHACIRGANYAASRETAGLEQSYSDLQPYTMYSIQVAAQNEYGVGEYSMPYMMKTEPSTSDPVTSLKVVPQGPFESVSEYKANVVVSWTSPCKSNGVIESFQIDFVGDRKGHDRQHFRRFVEPSYNEYGYMMHNETNLKPEFNYTVTMTVKTIDVAQLSTSIIGTFDAPSGIPEPLDEMVVAKATVDAYAASNPTHSAKVRFPAEILESESGNILYIALLLSEKNCNIEPQLRYGALDPYLEWPDTQTWNQVYNDDSTDCIRQYQSTPKHWYPIREDINADNNIDSSDARNTEVIEYVLGTEKCATAVGYCNGPLKPDTEYYLVLRLFTKSGYSDGAVLQFKTDSLIQLTVILISVIGCLLLAFVVGFIYLWVTKRIVWKRESLHGIEDSFGDTIAKNFAIFYRDVSKPEKINREFKELTVVAMDLSYTASELGCNKNRYADIFPYDKNRVILDIDAEGSDYINASFIDGYRRKKEYIATQGPKPESTIDFWRMILQHNVRVIVMVTQFREGDVVKCHEYFPFNSKTINVTVKKKECFEIYDRTEMCLTHAQYGLKQKVLHFYFKKWPDHGCPTDPMHLITFVRKVKAEKVPSYSPIVVHCSAGVGRTGTFIGLDIIMQRLRNETKINIYETVKKLRFQRMKMVQTLAQYSFLYACAYELVKHKRTRAALKYQKSNKKVSFEDDPEYNVNSLPPAPPLKFNGRRNNLDLSSVNELDFCDDNNTEGGSKQIEASNYGSMPIRFNGFHHKGDMESYDAYLENDIDSAKGRNTESVL